MIPQITYYCQGNEMSEVMMERACNKDAWDKNAYKVFLKKKKKKLEKTDIRITSLFTTQR